MFKVILEGLLIGLGLSYAIGPVFFALIDTAITKGQREGFKMALGISASDWIYAILAGLGIGGVMQAIQQSHWLTLAGGCVFILFGIYYLLKKPAPAQEWTPPDRTSYRKRFSVIGRGFVLNSINPSTPLIWLGASTNIGKIPVEHRLSYGVAFMASILLMVVGTDLLKVYLARRIRNLLTPTRITWLNRAVGIIMIAAGLRFLLVGLNTHHETGYDRQPVPNSSPQSAHIQNSSLLR